jgi:hypothetical protein
LPHRGTSSSDEKEYVRAIENLELPMALDGVRCRQLLTELVSLDAP